MGWGHERIVGFVMITIAIMIKHAAEKLREKMDLFSFCNCSTGSCDFRTFLSLACNIPIHAPIMRSKVMDTITQSIEGIV
jgi:hypothetical protein